MCVGHAAGWIPKYITVWRDEQLVGASFVYIKTNSYGEYIFDWDWAKAYHHHRLEYFPKLTSSIPFTPATGPKFLVRSDQDSTPVIDTLLSTSLKIMKDLDCSSLHYLFIPKEELNYFEAKQFFIRHSFQYHWQNQNYETFDAFLASLKPKRRKQIVRERMQLQAANLKIEWYSGDQLTEAHAELFFGFYLETIQKMSAIPYLNLAFFKSVFKHMSHEVALVLASEGDTAIAAALYFKKGDSLFGRYWGSSKDVRNLHFEICYYQPIEWAIANKIQRFEAGAQGEHKIARGLLPELTYSAHRIQHPQFRDAIGKFIEDEKQGIQQYFDDLKSHHPFLP